MVRAHMKTTADVKKDLHKKKVPQAKPKAGDSNLWPCKINGCNKEFAREADLKRHQRTTKTHSMPGFQCPQCEASFTRTDALRRHQKSRHHGVILDPVESTAAPIPLPDRGDEDGDSAFSRSRSRSHSPSNRQRSTPPHRSPMSMTHSPTAGPSSYYRVHTMMPGNVYIQPRAGPGTGEGVLLDSRYSQPVGLPTSATRGQGHWPPPPPWMAENRPMSYPPPPPPGAHHMYYQPSPYYRNPHHPIPPPPPPLGPSGHPAMRPSMTPSEGSEGGSEYGASMRAGFAQQHQQHPQQQHQQHQLPQQPEAHGIDPALEHASAGASAGAGASNARLSPVAVQQVAAESSSIAEAVNRVAGILQDQFMSKSDGAPQNAGVEDGETMLNPAELLTQESLASPPPSS